MQHGIETKAAVAILTENADYFAMLKHILYGGHAGGSLR